MSKQGRPRKRQSLFIVKDFIEYTSDSDSDANNVQHNVNYEIRQTYHRSKWLRVEQLQNDDQDNPQQEQEMSAEEQLGQEIDAEHQQEQEMFEEEQHEQEMSAEDHTEGQLTDDELPPNLEVQLHTEEQPHNLEVQLPYLNEQDLSDSSESDNLDPDENDYTAIFQNLKSDWLMTEIQHCVSKTATDAF